MKKIVLIVLVILAVHICLASVGVAKANDPAPSPSASTLAQASGKPIYRVAQDFHGVRVGASLGSTYGEVLASQGIRANMSYFLSAVDVTIALRQGKVDAFVNDDVILQVSFGDQSDLAILPAQRQIPTAFVFSKGNEALAQKFDAQIKKLEEGGGLKALRDTWFTPGTAGKSLPALPPLPPGAPVLRLAAAAPNMPFVYVADGFVMGYEVDLALRLAHALGMRLETSVMDFSGLLPAVLSNRADLAAGGINVTAERAQNVRFSHPTAQTGMTFLIRAENAPDANTKTVAAPQTSTSFWDSLKRSFERNLIEEGRWRMILSGLVETIVISLGSLVLGTVLGAGICTLRRSSRAALRWPAMLYIRVIQGTPIVVLLMIFYYIVLAKVPISGTLVAIMAFSCNFGAYVAEIFRSSLDALDKGQQEAATALGFSRWQRFRHITLPQAARITLPVFKGEFVSLIKMTAVVGYIAVQDLTKMSDLIRSRTYEPFFPLILTAAIYLCIAYLCILPLNRLEMRIDPAHRPRRIKGVSTKACSAQGVQA